MPIEMQIYPAKSVAKEINVSSTMFCRYIKSGKIKADYYHKSDNKGFKYYFFNKFTVNDIKLWRKSFEKSKNNSMVSIDEWREKVLWNIINKTNKEVESEKENRNKKRIKSRNKNGNGAHKK